MVFSVRTGGSQCYLYCGCPSCSHGAGWQGDRSSAARCGSQASCFLQKQGSSSNSSRPDAPSDEGEVFLHHASRAWRELPDWLDTLTLSAETLCVSTASTGDGEGWRQTSSFSFAVYDLLNTADSVHAEALRYHVSLFLKLSKKSKKFLRDFIRNFLNFLEISLEIS